MSTLWNRINAAGLPAGNSDSRCICTEKCWENRASLQAFLILSSHEENQWLNRFSSGHKPVCYGLVWLKLQNQPKVTMMTVTTEPLR